MIRKNDTHSPGLYSTINWGDRRQTQDSEPGAGNCSQELIAWNRIGTMICLAARCGECGGTGDFLRDSGDRVICDHCSGQGWFGIDPKMPVNAPAGSVAKMAMLTVRYASGVPLWNPQDGRELVDMRQFAADPPRPNFLPRRPRAAEIAETVS